MNKVIEEINARLNGEGYANVGDLIRARRRLYRIDNDGLSTDEFIEKLTVLKCLKELIEEDRPKKDEIVDMDQAARLLGCSISWVSRLISTDRLVVIGNNISKASVVKYLQNKRSPGRPKGTFRAKKKVA